MFESGRICVKTAGRDAGLRCVIVDNLDKNYVLVDGETRRKKCNINHLEPTATILQIQKNAAHDEITKAFADIGITLISGKPKTAGKRPAQRRKVSKTAHL